MLARPNIEQKAMIAITQDHWDKIHSDFKGGLPCGARSCFAGCIPGGRGTDLWAEGVHFTVTPRPKAPAEKSRRRPAARPAQS
jgi:hypothetical protein